MGELSKLKTKHWWSKDRIWGGKDDAWWVWGKVCYGGRVTCISRMDAPARCLAPSDRIPEMRHFLVVCCQLACAAEGFGWSRE